MSGSILYLGGSYPQRIAVRSLVEAGFEVHVTDRSPTPPCADATPFIHQIDATDTDAILELAVSLRDNDVLIGAYGIADYAFDSVAAVSRFVGGRMPAPDALAAMTDKAATQTRLADASVPVPRTLWSGPHESFVEETPDLADCSVGNVIVKPASENASAGISQVAAANADELGAAVAAAATNGDSVVIEEFVDGEIRNLDVLAIEGEVRPISITRRQADPDLDFLPAIQYQFARSNEPELEELSAMAAGIADALGYRNGPFTVDYIAADDGPKVLEVSPHFHSIAQEIRRGNGNPLRAWCRYLARDADWSDDLNAPDERCSALLMLRAHDTGWFAGFENDAIFDEHPFVDEQIQLKNKGARIETLAARDGLVALAWLTAPSRDAVVAAAEQLLQSATPLVEQAPAA